MTNESMALGAIVPEIKHDFFPSAIDGMLDLAYKHGFTIIVPKSNEADNREVLNTHNMLANQKAD